MEIGLLTAFRGGVAGFCAGPMLGAVLTLAAGQGSVARAGVLSGTGNQLAVILGLGALALALWWRADRRRRRPAAPRRLRSRHGAEAPRPGTGGRR